jgi:hypothetical protein
MRSTRRLVVLFSALAAAVVVSACAHSPKEAGPPSPVVEFVTRQETLTPLPLRVRLPAKLNADRVLVFFHTWGSRRWGLVELARYGQTWSGEVSCREVSTVTGDTKYFFLALDNDGEPVIGSGSPDWPHVATIVGELPDGAQALPGSSAPVRCHDPADCPPDFPGCPAYAFVRHACSGDKDCEKDNVRCAWDGYCGTPSAPPVADDPQADEEEMLARAIRQVTKRYKVAAATMKSKQ